MLPEIASLDERMAQGGDWMAFREEIADLHQKATTQDEYLTLLRAHSILGHLADEVYATDIAAEIKNVHRAEYMNFLNKEACEANGIINPAMLGKIVEREIHLGRLDENDDYAQFARAGGQVLGDSTYSSSNPSRNGTWFTLGVCVVAVVLWLASIKPFGFSPLWLIFFGFAAGWWINEREATKIKHETEIDRARRGY